MSFPDILLSPPIIFLIFLAAGFLLYGLGGLLKPKSRKVGGKLEPYACGEDMPDNPITVNYRLFFYIALFFTIMHVSVLVVATVPSGALALLAVPYLLMISLSVAALVTRN
jgi:NADH:ubiquinone oxidoreductase subunit 3 (subunit A)